MSKRNEFSKTTHVVIHGLNCQKSAEAILPGQTNMTWEGLNIRRFRRLERFERNAKKADNFI